MRLSRVLGILSLLMFIFAILSIVLPAFSVISGVRINTSGNGSAGIPTSVLITNGGFLPVNGISLSVTMSAPNGTRISSISLGPVDVPAGATVPLNIVQSGTTQATASLSFVTLKAVASVNLGGLIPVSVTADFTVVPGSSSSSGGAG
jgi:hypothetical protein